MFEHPLIGYQWLELLFIGCPIAIAAAVLAHNLFELELIIKRSLLYAALAAPFVGVYAGILVSSRALPTHSLFIALVAGGVAALAFRPIHHRVQRTITRLVYGARGNPYELLSQINSADGTRQASSSSSPRRCSSRCGSPTRRSRCSPRGAATRW